MNKIIFLDTETTDTLAEPWMIQLGYIVCDLKFNEIKRENMFFSTDKVIDFWAMAIHHITPKILQEKLLEDKRTNDEKKVIASTDFEWAYLVAHNSPFDKNVLDCNWIVTSPDQWIDSYNIAYNIFTEDDMKHSLQYLRYFLKIEFSEEINPHDALSDVIVLKEVFRVIFSNYPDTRIQHDCVTITYTELLDDMVTRTKEWIILRVWGFGKYKWSYISKTFEKDRWYFERLKSAKELDRTDNDAMYNTLCYYLNKK